MPSELAPLLVKKRPPKANSKWIDPHRDALMLFSLSGDYNWVHSPFVHHEDHRHDSHSQVRRRGARRRAGRRRWSIRAGRRAAPRPVLVGYTTVDRAIKADPKKLTLTGAANIAPAGWLGVVVGEKKGKPVIEAIAPNRRRRSRGFRRGTDYHHRRRSGWPGRGRPRRASR